MIYNYFSDEFLARAGKEYYERQASKVLSITNTLNEQVSNDLQSNDDTVIMLPSGAVTISEIVNAIRGVQINDDILSAPIMLGDETRRINTTLSNVLQELMNQYTSLISEAALANAYSLSTKVNERVSLFRDYLSSKLNNAYADVTGYIDFVAADIYGEKTYADHVVTLAKADGINKADSDLPLDQLSDVYRYTGVTPCSATATAAGIAKAGSTSMQICKTAIKAGFKFGLGIIKFTEKLIGKGINWLKQKTVDPVDYELISKDGNNTFADLYYETSFTASNESLPIIGAYLNDSNILIDTIFAEIIISKQAHQQAIITSGGEDLASIANAIGTFIHDNNISYVSLSSLPTRQIFNICNFFGNPLKNYESIVQALDDADPEYLIGSSVIDSLNRLYVKLQQTQYSRTLLARIKFKAINPDIVDFSVLGSPKINSSDNSYYYKRGDVDGLFSKAKLSGDVYVNPENKEEVHMFQGLMLSACLLPWLLKSYRICADSNTLNGSLYVQVPDKINAMVPGVGSVTNAGFYGLLTDTYATIQSYNSALGGSYIPSINDALSDAVEAILLLKHNSNVEPIFLPYVTDSVTWAEPSLRLIPDQEHIASYQTFVEKAIYAIIVTTVIVTVGVAVRKAATKLLLNSEREINSIVYGSDPITSGSVSTYRKACRSKAISEFLMKFLNFGCVAGLVTNALPSTTRGSDQDMLRKITEINNTIGDSNTSLLSAINEVRTLIKN